MHAPGGMGLRCAQGGRRARRGALVPPGAHPATHRRRGGAPLPAASAQGTTRPGQAHPPGRPHRPAFKLKGSLQVHFARAEEVRNACGFGSP
jgi:hypothetical protein